MTEARDRYVRIERHESVAVLRLERPKVNALSPELIDDLAACLDELHADLPGAIVVYGGEKIFAAGADIARFGGPDEARVLARKLLATFNTLALFPRVTIAAVNGFALGGGCELAIACDLRVASETAVFGQPEILLGIIPGAGGTQRLPRLVGVSRAKDIALSGRQVKADEALRIGLADRVVAPADTFTAALAWAQEFARGALAAQTECKRAIDGGLNGSLADGLLLEQDCFVSSFRSEDSRIGIDSFLQNGPGKAAFTGR